MTVLVSGSFSNTGPSAFTLGAVEGPVSGPLDIPTYKGLTGTFQLRLTLLNNAESVIDASNTVKLQKRLDNAAQTAWVDQATYNSAQNAALVTVVGDDSLPTPGEQWRVALVTQQALKSLEYELSLENFTYTTGATYV